MLITPSFKKSLIVEQFQGNYLKLAGLIKQSLHACKHCILKSKSQAHLQYSINGFRRLIFLFERGEQKPNGSLKHQRQVKIWRVIQMIANNIFNFYKI